MLETPADPASYMREASQDYATFTTWPELTQVLEYEMGLSKINMHQGALGHARCEPTHLWSDIQAIKDLDGLQDHRSQSSWPDTVEEADRQQTLTWWSVGSATNADGANTIARGAGGRSA